MSKTDPPFDGVFFVWSVLMVAAGIMLSMFVYAFWGVCK